MDIVDLRVYILFYANDEKKTLFFYFSQKQTKQNQTY